MKLIISPDRTIASVQADFHAEYPYLRLAFFSKAHEAYKGSNAKFLYSKPETTLHELNSHLKDGYLLIEEDMPTWQLERLLETEFGLHTQVFRKSGNIWLETSVSDDLTLEQQNAKGHASEHIHQEFVDPLDYREQI